MADKKQSKKKVPKMGAPNKHESEKILPNHLRPDQWQRMEEEAAIRNMPTWAFIRLVIDWGVTGLDTKRGDVAASKMFDDILAKGEK